MIPGNAEDRGLGSAPKALQVIYVAVQNHPSNTRSYCGFGSAGQPGVGQRLQQNRIRPRGGRRLDNLQYLLTLDYAVVIGVKNLHFRSEANSRLGGRCGLLMLVTVIVWKR